MVFNSFARSAGICLPGLRADASNNLCDIEIKERAEQWMEKCFEMILYRKISKGAEGKMGPTSFSKIVLGSKKK